MQKGTSVSKQDYDLLDGKLELEKKSSQSHASEIVRLTTKQENLDQNIESEKNRNEEQQKRIEGNHSLITELKTQIATLNAGNNSLQEKLETQKDDFEEARKKSLLEFENVAAKLLEEKTEKFDKEQKKSLEIVLNPLKEKIKIFEEKVEKSNQDSIERHSALRTQIFTLKELNERMSTDANNLTRALKGDSKTQGNWGELILESILEKSGLEKDREYFVQSSFTNEDGRRLRPDVVIHLPQNKKMIIDAKASIKAYEQLVNTTDEQEQKKFIKEHAASVKAHVDNLSSKNYQGIGEIESPDFVLMFIPIDTAFSAALAENPNLYTYAFEKNIVIVTPATLLATLKTVDTMWKNEKQQRYAVEIAEEAGKMYDKFSALVDDLVSLGKRIDQTKDHYQESMKKLYHGRGDLITRAEKLKSLGVKVKKGNPSKFN